MPQLFVGRVRVFPQNMQVAPDRVQFLDGFVAYLNSVLDHARPWLGHPIPMDQVHALVKSFTEVSSLVELVEENQLWVARAHSWAHDYISFNPSRLTIAFVDGRNRSAKARMHVPTGEATASFARFISLLQRGATDEELLGLGEELELDVQPLLEKLLERGMVDELPEPADRVDPRFRHGEGDTLTWLSHAAVQLQSGPTTIWVDPYIMPRVQFAESEIAGAFSPEHAEARLFERYTPADCGQLTTHELPTPDAVCITHQDTDHIDAGVLMTLPRSTLLIVPRSSGHPWDVDLARYLRTVLGPDREIIELDHGRTVRIRDTEITAFPFRGEFPNPLPHSWNCYLVEMSGSKVACTADSRLFEEQIEFLRQKKNGKPMTLLAGLPRPQETRFGWRESDQEPFNLRRLYPWYLPLVRWFEPTQFSNVSYEQLSELARNADLQKFFPYATGSAPWLRLPEPIGVSLYSLSLKDFEEIERELAKVEPRVEMLPARYGRPIRVDR
jgi:L-ascorbate metabolism protein UlaG (beta-lactamase superfamily)